MPKQFQFRHLDYSQALCDYTTEQLEKAGRLLLKDGKYQVYYSKEKHLCHVEVSVQSPWGYYKAEASADDFYVAADQVAEKLGRQFQKSKEKHQHHKRPEFSKEGLLENVNDALEYEVPRKPKRTA